MKREFLTGLMELPKEVVDAIMAENGRDIQAAKETAEQWRSRYEQAVQEHGKELAKRDFDAKLQQQILRQGGRNHKAITALLDLQSLENADESVIAQAVEQVKQECAYLFCLPAGFASGTGAVQPEERKSASLADALKEKFGA